MASIDRGSCSVQPHYDDASMTVVDFAHAFTCKTNNIKLIGILVMLLDNNGTEHV